MAFVFYFFKKLLNQLFYPASFNLNYFFNVGVFSVSIIRSNLFSFSLFFHFGNILTFLDFLIPVAFIFVSFYLELFVLYILPSIISKIQIIILKVLDTKLLVFDLLYFCIVLPYFTFVFFIRSLFLNKIIYSNFLYVLPIIIGLNTMLPGLLFPHLNFLDTLLLPFITGITLISFDNNASLMSSVLLANPQSYYLSRLKTDLTAGINSNFAIVRYVKTTTILGLIVGKTPMGSVGRGALLSGCFVAGAGLYNGYADRVQRDQFHQDEFDHKRGEFEQRKIESDRAWANYERNKATWDSRSIFTRGEQPKPPKS